MTRGRDACRRLTIAIFVLAAGRPARAEVQEQFPIDPCTIPDLGGGERWGGAYRRGVAFFVVVTNLSARPARVLSLADGIAGYRTGEVLRLQIDIRDGSGSRPRFPVAIHLSALGGGFVRPEGKIYRCNKMDFFWSRSGDRATRELGIDVVEYIIGDQAAVAGLVPDDTVSGLVRPLWAITERLRIVFGQTEAEGDEQHNDGDVEYPVRPERGGSARKSPDPMRAADPGRGLFLGPSLESHYTEIVLQPIRRFVAFRNDSERSHVVTARASTRDEHGTMITHCEPILLRRLGTTNLFVGSFIVMPDGYPDRDLDGPLVRLEVGNTNLRVEIEDGESDR